MSKTTPNQTERLAALHAQGVDWKSRTIWIVGDLLDNKGYQYVPALRLLDETPGEIKVVIMSEGGAESGGFAIYDTLRTLRNRVTTIALGQCFSIAALIFQGGDKRLIAPNCELMMHNGSIPLEGGDVDTDYIEELALEAAKNNSRYHVLISERADAPLHLVKEWCKNEVYFSAEEAVKAGLADGIAKSWKDL